MDAMTTNRIRPLELPKPLTTKDAAATVIHWHNVSRQCGEGMLEAAMKAGKVLIDQRELHCGRTKRGGSHFTAWCRKSLPFDEGQARRYIKIAENWDELRRVRRSSEEPLSIRGALKLIAACDAANKPKPVNTPAPPSEPELIDNREPVEANRTIRESRTVEADHIADANKMVAPVHLPESEAAPTCKEPLPVQESTPTAQVKESLFDELEPALKIDLARQAIQSAIDALKALGRSPEGDDYRVDDALADVTRAKRTIETSSPVIERQIEKIRLAYPRKVGRPTAEKAIRKALGRATFEHLYERTTAYAAAVMDADPDLIPHPGTWFNDERWDDGEREWQASAGIERKRRETARANGPDLNSGYRAAKAEIAAMREQYRNEGRERPDTALRRIG